MKKIVLALPLFITASLTAQITITSADMPNAGDSILLSVTNTVGAIDPALTGPSYNWDFSTLTPNFQRPEKFDSPFSFPTPFNILFNIFNTSYGKDNNTITSIPLPGVSFDAAYDFMKESSSKLKQIGAGFTINAIPLPFLYGSDDIVYTFPMNYLNQDSCDYKYGLDIPTVGYYGQTGHRVNIVDGWGMVTTPYGTFNALRVKSKIAAIDSINILGFGTNIPRPLKYEYKWLATAKQIPVLQIDASDLFGTITVTNVQYIDTIVPGVPYLGIAENQSSSFNSTAFPNPCIENISIGYNLQEKAAIHISFIDVLGKTVATVLNETKTAGNYQQQISIADLNLVNGVYFLVLQTDKAREVHKIVVGK
jgi:Secretion system C-terminal sorting domain